MSGSWITGLVTDFGIGLLADVRQHDQSGQITDEVPGSTRQGSTA